MFFGLQIFDKMAYTEGICHIFFRDDWFHQLPPIFIGKA